MVLVGAGDGDAGRRVEWLKPIDQVEAEIRRDGMFLLVDMNGRRLWFYGCKNQPTINRVVDSLRKRRVEMVNFLIARMRAEGETT